MTLKFSFEFYAKKAKKVHSRKIPTTFHSTVFSLSTYSDVAPQITYLSSVIFTIAVPCTKTLFTICKQTKYPIPLLLHQTSYPYTNNYLILLFQPNQNNFNLTNHNLQNKKQSNLQPINHKKNKIQFINSQHLKSQTQKTKKETTTNNHNAIHRQTHQI